MTPDEIRGLIDIPVRPEADAFPMLDPDAFGDLVEGIRANGQIEPIELDADGAIGDGRNRYAACRALGIEPRTVALPAEIDWFARVVERNLNRRHATLGARAVALVKAEGDSQRISTRSLARIGGLSQPTILRARFIVDHAPDLAGQVEGGASLLAAYTQAVERERAQTDAERLAVDVEARRVELLEALDAERARLIEVVRKEQDAVGAPVTLPPEPSLALRIESAPAVEQRVVPPAEMDVEALRAQERLHKQLRKLKADLAAIRDVEIGPDAPMYEGLVMAFRSWGSQVVALTYEIVERHNAALENGGALRRVK